jgi:CheY-like chemotaxis protein
MKRKTVLVVEDDRDVRDSLSELLELEGYRAVAAGSGVEALDLLKRAVLKPCLILLDWLMPGMSGHGFLEAARRSPKLASVPVIVLSGATAGDEAEEAARAGASSYLTKPLEVESLLRAIRKHCD